MVGVRVTMVECKESYGTGASNITLHTRKHCWALTLLYSSCTVDNT